MRAYLQLMRPANIITAMADIMAGFAGSGLITEIIVHWEKFPFPTVLPLLLLSTIGLYGGGVVFNDVFDAKLDAIERPERPIPSGRATLQGAIFLGVGLLLLGVLAAFMVSAISGIIAILISALALLYNKYGKHHPFLGPINMGACRGGNLLLGVSAFPDALHEWWFIALIPIAYIAAITSISRGEVHGGNKSALLLAFILYSLVILSIAVLGLIQSSQSYKWLQVLPFLALFAWLIFPPLSRAWKDLKPQNIGKAVKAGIIALIVMDAALAVSFGVWWYGLLILLLLPVSRFLARQFAVT
ncbi:UbiA-like protein EboC [Rhodocytophaga rosea]|uniref:UbiA-like protein EboC n=1 Tax=Rhodocytophaga rosea TaxID=2704465 RepID=A0A6C0GIP1_9BACT|nr:UbiA-like protein EboC [Rhodocytophaga rosea]QHT67704.1 UbiA-like protein EboC [Rhodocytophaga rosea]